MHLEDSVWKWRFIILLYLEECLETFVLCYFTS